MASKKIGWLLKAICMAAEADNSQASREVRKVIGKRDLPISFFRDAAGNPCLVDLGGDHSDFLKAFKVEFVEQDQLTDLDKQVLALLQKECELAKTPRRLRSKEDREGPQPSQKVLELLGLSSSKKDKDAARLYELNLLEKTKPVVTGLASSSESAYCGASAVTVFLDNMRLCTPAVRTALEGGETA